MNNFGTIYINSDFSQFTILVYKEESDGRYSWSAGDGLMISAPATNRDEALSISDHLMKKLIKGGGRKSLDDF